MRNHIINTLSRFVGKHFAKCYRRNWVSANYTLRVLDAYISLRQKLPLMADGKHWGNHYYSRMLPWRATQYMA